MKKYVNLCTNLTANIYPMRSPGCLNVTGRLRHDM